MPGGQVWDAAHRAAVDARYYIAGPETFVALLDMAVPGTHVEADGLQSFRAAVSMLAGEAVDVVSIQGRAGSPPTMDIEVRLSQGHAFDLSLIVFGTEDVAWPPRGPTHARFRVDRGGGRSRPTEAGHIVGRRVTGATPLLDRPRLR